MRCFSAGDCSDACGCFSTCTATRAVHLIWTNISASSLVTSSIVMPETFMIRLFAKYSKQCHPRAPSKSYRLVLRSLKSQNSWSAPDSPKSPLKTSGHCFLTKRRAEKSFAGGPQLAESDPDTHPTTRGICFAEGLRDDHELLFWHSNTEVVLTKTRGFATFLICANTHGGDCHDSSPYIIPRHCG